MVRKFVALSLSATVVLAGCSSNGVTVTAPAAVPVTSSQVIKHVVVIFGENVSFDHYFGTYPTAKNPAGQTQFTAATGTPVPANLTGSLLTANPNSTNTANGAGATNPYRLDPSAAATNDQDHNYGPEQTAFDNGKMDLFPLSVGVPDSAALAQATGTASITTTNGLTMGYYDGNTVTGLWNYAQHYALNDHAFGSTFGPSTPGAINLVSGQTNGAVSGTGTNSALTADGSGGFSDTGDSDPTGDICSSTSSNFSMTGNNIGAMLTKANISWGFFEGGFDLTKTNANGSTACGRNTTSQITGVLKADYIPHHQPFQYYASTANPNHVRPTSISAIGTTDAANHQYDTHDFNDALAAGNMPAVSFLKAPGFQDGHAGYSDPLDEQTFVINEINAIEQSSFWSSTAIIVTYDDSDGWYDHIPMIVNGSATAADTLAGPGLCSSSTASGATALPGVSAATLHAQGRCGYGPRIPLLVISPWARKNALDSTVVDQSSVSKFIEDTFLASARIGGGSFDSIAGSLDNSFNFSSSTIPNPNVVLLNPITGAVTSGN
jgi:phospholipase C